MLVLLQPQDTLLLTEDVEHLKRSWTRFYTSQYRSDRPQDLSIFQFFSLDETEQFIFDRLFRPLLVIEML